MKRISKMCICLFLALVLMGTFTKAAYGEESGFQYFITENSAGTKEVCIYGYNGTEENLIIPEEIEGYKVGEVNFISYIFGGDVRGLNKTVKTVTLPSSVRIFNGSFLESLEDIIIDENNPYIESEDGIVYNKSKQLMFIIRGKSGVLDIKEGVTGFSEEFVCECPGITAINLPASFKQWYNNTSFPKLECINISHENTEFASVDGILYDKEKKTLIYCPNGKGGEVNIPDSVTVIEYGAFLGCNYIKNITIPDSVTGIGEYAFSGCESLEEINFPNTIEKFPTEMLSYCTSLKSITIPASVKSISAGVFKLSGLTEIKVDENSADFSVRDGMLCDKKGQCLIMYPPNSEENVNIPEYITSIADMAFTSGTEIVKVVIPDSVKSLGNNLFENCTCLEEVVLPEGIKSIPYSAFSLCENLKKINIPSTVTEIGDDAFCGCTSLKSITIPENVTNIGMFILLSSGIENVKIESAVLNSIANYAFETFGEEVNIYVDDEGVYNRINSNKSSYGQSINLILNKKPDPLQLSTYDVTLYTGSAKKSITVKATLTGISGTVKWKTSKKSVATVKNGRITAVGKGTSVITASVGEYTKKIKVTVKNPTITVSDGSESVSTIKVKRGKAVYYRVHVNPSKSGIKLAVDKNAKKFAKVTLKNNILTVKGIKKGNVKFKLQSGKTSKTVNVRIN